MASTSFQPVPVKTEDLSPERERVLRMLDEGKITADESAELLNALGHTVQPPPLPGVSVGNPNHKLVLTGLVLMVIGFFLPWFSVNLGDEMGRVFSGMQQQMSEIARENPGMVVQMPNTGTTHIAGADVHYGLGWLVLLLSIAAAALPYVAGHLDADTQRKARLVGLGIGSFVLIYLFSQSLRFVSIGILLALAGYGLQWVGILKEREAAPVRTPRGLGVLQP